MKRLLPVLPFLSLGALLLLPSQADAQCYGGESFCAEFHVGASIGGSVRIGPPAPPPPARAQVIIIEEEPAPPPPVVVYQPAPPPPPTTVVVHETRPVQTHVRYHVEPQFSGIGLHAHLGGMFTDRVHMGGLAGALRIRPDMGHFGVDIGLGVYGGEDWNGQDRVEVPLTADVLLFVNPRSRLQFYGVAGIGVSFAHTNDPADYDPWTDTYYGDEGRDYGYVGGQLGIGLELRLGRRFAINGDVRGFVRERVDSNSDSPEFVDPDTGRTTNTSGGVVGNIGATLYF